MVPVIGGTRIALHCSPVWAVPQGAPSPAVPAVDEYVPTITDCTVPPPGSTTVEPSKLSVPVKVKVCVPAIAVRVTFWPLIVPVIAADPLLHGVESCGNETA